jgi:hypothetical protein
MLIAMGRTRTTLFSIFRFDPGQCLHLPFKCCSQREMEVKDDIIAKLNEEMVKKESQLRNEVEKVRRTLNVEFAEYKKESVATIEDLKTRLGEAETELSILESYRINKAKHDEELANLKKSLAEQMNFTKNALEDQDRYFS